MDYVEDRIVVVALMLFLGEEVRYEVLSRCSSQSVMFPSGYVSKNGHTVTGASFCHERRKVSNAVSSASA